jgi:hypothetical protein
MWQKPTVHINCENLEKLDFEVTQSMQFNPNVQPNRQRPVIKHVSEIKTTIRYLVCKRP